MLRLRRPLGQDTQLPNDPFNTPDIAPPSNDYGFPIGPVEQKQPVQLPPIDPINITAKIPAPDSSYTPYASRPPSYNFTVAAPNPLGPSYANASSLPTNTMLYAVLGGAALLVLAITLK